MNTPSPSALLELSTERFVSLTTFRRSGVPVSTPVWTAREGDALVVTTPDKSGKVKRLRNSGRVELRPCSRTGAVADDAITVPGVAEILDGPADVTRISRIFSSKYGFEYRIFMIIERIAARRQKPRVMLRITGG